jgi:hypothetical protein
MYGMLVAMSPSQPHIMSKEREEVTANDIITESESLPARWMTKLSSPNPPRGLRDEPVQKSKN